MKDINDPENIFVVLPTSSLMQNLTLHSMSDWNTMFTKTKANYDSLNEPVVYTPN